MSSQSIPDPAMFQKMRETVLFSQPEGVAPDEVYAVLMDWNVASGTASVLAAADGTASVYLSNGGAYIGGGEQNEELRRAAINAVDLAAMLLSQFHKTDFAGLPPQEIVGFFAMTGDGRFLATAREETLTAGTDPLCALGGAMQAIITGYQLITEEAPATA